MTRNTKWDYLKRHYFLKNELQLKILKSIIADSRSPVNDKLQAASILNMYFWKTSKGSTHNYCTATHWAHSVLSKFWLSWMQFKEYAVRGLLPGVKKWNY